MRQVFKNKSVVAGRFIWNEACVGWVERKHCTLKNSDAKFREPQQQISLPPIQYSLGNALSPSSQPMDITLNNGAQCGLRVPVLGFATSSKALLLRSHFMSLSPTYTSRARRLVGCLITCYLTVTELNNLSRNKTVKTLV